MGKSVILKISAQILSFSWLESCPRKATTRPPRSFSKLTLKSCGQQEGGNSQITNFIRGTAIHAAELSADLSIAQFASAPLNGPGNIVASNQRQTYLLSPKRKDSPDPASGAEERAPAFDRVRKRATRVRPCGSRNCGHRTCRRRPLTLLRKQNQVSRELSTHTQNKSSGLYDPWNLSRIQSSYLQPCDLPN